MLHHLFEYNAATTVEKAEEMSNILTSSLSTDIKKKKKTNTPNVLSALNPDPIYTATKEKTGVCPLFFLTEH